MVHVPLMFLSDRREFPSAPCLAGGKKKLDDSSRIAVVVNLSVYIAVCDTVTSH